MALKQNDDDHFLSLLSTQREILKLLKREKSVGTKDDMMFSAQQIEESRKKLSTLSTKHGIFANDSDPFSLMNEPIIERHPCRDELLNMPPTFPCGSATAFYNNNGKSRRKMISMMDLSNIDTTASDWNATRRNSLSGMIANALAVDVDSTSSIIQKADIYTAKRADGKVLATKDRFKVGKGLNSNRIDSAILRREFVNFVVAMEKSMKSQQDIHDWDRKMGLKRSHSKTMRLSMRSRNRLRKVVINA